MGLQTSNGAWLGTLLVFCALGVAYLMPFLWNSLLRFPGWFLETASFEADRPPS